MSQTKYVIVVGNRARHPLTLKRQSPRRSSRRRFSMYAEGIARSAASALDEPGAVSPAADLALEEIARELHIDHGESWGKLLGEHG